MPGHHAVAGNHQRLHPEILATVRHQLVQFLEGAGIEQRQHPLARRQFPGLVLAPEPVLAAPQLGLSLETGQFLEGLFHEEAPLACSQSLRKRAMPLSVSGCLNMASITAGGHVQTSAPICAATTTCIGWRTLATSTSVWKS